MMPGATLPAIGLGIIALVWIGLLPRIFFRRGRLNLQWWLNSVPFWISGFALLGTLLGLLRPFRPSDAAAQGLAGASLVLTLLGVALLAWTLATHRRPLALWHQTDDEPEDLVTEGPYARVRHPFYLSFLMSLAGCALAAPGWPTLLALVYGAHRLNATAAREERRLLGSAFGRRYGDYVRQTGRFLPRWRRLRIRPALRRSPEAYVRPRHQPSEPLQE